MARTSKTLPAKIDIAHLISAGVLASACPRALIEEVLTQTDKASKRERLLPAPAVVYYVMALASGQLARQWRLSPTAHTRTGGVWHACGGGCQHGALS